MLLHKKVSFSTCFCRKRHLYDTKSTVYRLTFVESSISLPRIFQRWNDIDGRFPKPILILHETVFTVAQSEQFAAAEEEENLVVPDKFPQDAAHAHLLLGGKFFARDDRIFNFLHLIFLESHLHNLIAKVDEGDARGMVAAVHNHVDSVSQFLIVIEEMYGISVVIHGYSVLDDGAKIGIISELTTFWSSDGHFFTPYINMSRRFCTFAPVI